MNPDRPFGLGRGHAEDSRDKSFLMESLIKPREASDRVYRYWNQSGWWGNQGQYPHCVAYAWLHWAEDGPVTHKQTPHGGHDPLFPPKDLYCACQKVDEWEGDCSVSRYDGTSVRAGAKVLKEQGLIESYTWAWDIDTAIDAVLTKGPVVLGTWWYESMFWPSPFGFVHISGRRAGGHAYLMNGVNKKHGVIRLKNSWGREWGKNGNFYMRIADVDRLIREDGEACLAVEKQRGA